MLGLDILPFLSRDGCIKTLIEVNLIVLNLLTGLLLQSVESLPD